jgi:hypothetical protein
LQNSPQRKRQQKTLWAEVRKETGIDTDRVEIRHPFADDGSIGGRSLAEGLGGDSFVLPRCTPISAGVEVRESCNEPPED